LRRKVLFHTEEAPVNTRINIHRNLMKMNQSQHNQHPAGISQEFQDPDPDLIRDHLIQMTYLENMLIMRLDISLDDPHQDLGPEVVEGQQGKGLVSGETQTKKTHIVNPQIHHPLDLNPPDQV